MKRWEHGESMGTLSVLSVGIVLVLVGGKQGWDRSDPEFQSGTLTSTSMRDT